MFFPGGPMVRHGGDDDSTTDDEDYTMADIAGLDDDDGSPKLELEVDLRIGDTEDAGDGLCVARRITFEKMYGVDRDVAIVEYDSPDVDGAAFVDGLPSSKHLTPVVVAGYLADHLKLPLVAEIRSRKFPPMSVIEKSTPMSPMRILGNKTVCVIMSEFKVSDSELANDIAEAVLDFVDRHRCTHLYTVEGVPQQLFEREIKERKKRAEERTKQAHERELKEAEDPLVKQGGSGSDGGATDAKADDGGVGDKNEASSAAPGKATADGADGSGEAKADDVKGDEARAAAAAGAATGKGKGKGKGSPKKGNKKSKRITRREKQEKKQEKSRKLAEKLMFLTTDPEMQAKLHELNHIPLKSGVVEGLTGHIIGSFHTLRVPMTCLLASCESQLPDALSAVAVVKTLDVLLPSIKIDLEPLRRKAEDLEKSIGELKTLIMSGGVGAGAHKTDRPAGMYM